MRAVSPQSGASGGGRWSRSVEAGAAMPARRTRARAALQLGRKRGGGEKHAARSIGNEVEYKLALFIVWEYFWAMDKVHPETLYIRETLNKSTMNIELKIYISGLL